MKNITARIAAAGKGTKNYQNKEVIDSYSLVVSTHDRGLQEVVRAKLYMGRSKSASTVYANVWIFGPSSAHRGSGSAGGYGYHKESEALARAFEDAGVRLYHTPKGSTEEVPFDDKATMDALSADIPEPMRTKFVTDRATIFDICSAWNLPSRELAKTSVEIPSLVLAGTFDPITPPAWSQLTASRLPNSTYVEVEGSGHGVFCSGDCARDLVVAFVNDPASAAGKSCPPVTNLG